MSRSQPRLRRLAADAATAFLGYAPVGRVFDWLALQRRRAVRRAVEARLRAAGEYGDVVTDGPFRGLQYPPGWADSRFEKIIGAYEAELHPLLESLCAQSFTDIVNIGAAEGYYAVGLARRISGAIVHAFEMEPGRRQMCQAMAELNGVAARVRVLGAATASALSELKLGPRVLVVCDCEGAERELLQPAAAPWLRAAELLVEVHEFMAPGVSDALRRRFADTHALQVIPTAGLAYARYPILRRLTFAEIHAMVGEERAQLMDWFHFKLKA